MSRFLKAAASAVFLVALSACGSSTSLHSIVGTLDTHSSATATLPPNASACLANCPPLPVGPHGYCGASGFDDIPRSGKVPVTVKDGSGKVLAKGTLSAGTYAKPSSAVVSGQLENSDCRFTFHVSGVPEAASYKFDVAAHIDVATFSLAEIKAKNWSVDLQLAD